MVMRCWLEWWGRRWTRGDRAGNEGRRECQHHLPHLDYSMYFFYKIQNVFCQNAKCIGVGLVKISKKLPCPVYGYWAPVKGDRPRPWRAFGILYLLWKSLFWWQAIMLRCGPWWVWLPVWSWVRWGLMGRLGCFRESRLTHSVSQPINITSKMNICDICGTFHNQVLWERRNLNFYPGTCFKILISIIME